MQTDNAPRELNRLEVLRGLRIATWEAAFATVWASLTTGAFLTGFALWIGARDLQIGFLTAIPTSAGLIQLLSSYVGERLPARKPFTAWFSIIGRGLWLPILLLPFVLGRGLSLAPFLFLFLLSYICLNVPAPAYMSWMSDLVPPDHRGRYFARRNMIAGIVGMLVGLPAAWFLDYATRQTHQEAFGFAVLFGIGVAGGVASFLCLMRQPEPPKHAVPPEPDRPLGLAGVLEYYRTPFADQNFRRLITFNVVLGLGQFFAAPFFTVYALESLGLNYVQLQIFATLTSLSSLGSMPLWGYLSDKFGSKPLLGIGTFGTFTLPLFWIFTSRDNPTATIIFITLVNLIGGASWAGVGLTQFNLLIRLSPPGKTAVYVATMSAVTGLTGGLAPMAGGVLMRALEDWQAPLFGLVMRNFQVAFFISAILRLTALLFLRSLEDSQAVSARDVLQQLTHADPRAWLHIRRLQRGSGIEARLKATEALGEARTQLAVAELKTALQDPGLAVRAEAARALGEIGDKAAVEALAEALQDPAADVVEEVACALGQIGDREAVPALLHALHSPYVSRLDRLAVIRTLGRLGGPEAAHTLHRMFEEAQDEETTEALARALGDANENTAVPILLSRLMQREMPRGLRAAIVRALGQMRDDTAVPALRQELARSEEDAVLLPAVADALSRLQDRESLPALVRGLTKAESLLARKQVAYAIGVLMGESAGLYSLLTQEVFARDEAVSKILQECQRRMRSPEAREKMDTLLSAFVSGDYGVCLQLLAEAANASSLAPKSPYYEVTQALAEQNSAPVEAVLVGLIALRGLLTGE